jgi:uncharacterized protein YjfI (DUF2170 family)
VDSRNFGRRRANLSPAAERHTVPHCGLTCYVRNSILRLIECRRLRHTTRGAMKPLLEQLRGLDSLAGAAMGGLAVQLQPMPGDVPVVQISIEGREELPIFLTCSDAQILCMCYLWSDSEVLPARRTELLEALLDLNPSVPLSAFGRIGDRFVLVGALVRDARIEDVAREIAVLSDNALDALDALSEFLK